MKFVIGFIIVVLCLISYSCGSFVERYRPDGTYSKQQQIRYLTEGRTDYDDVGDYLRERK